MIPLIVCLALAPGPGEKSRRWKLTVALDKINLQGRATRLRSAFHAEGT